MKVLSFVLVVVLAAAVKSDDAMMKVMAECKASVGASDDDVAKFINHAPLDSKPQMCLFACLMGSMNVIKDGKLQKDGMLALANQMTGGDAEKMAAAEEIFAECSGITAADPCESAAKAGMCMIMSGQKKGIIFKV